MYVPGRPDGGGLRPPLETLVVDSDEHGRQAIIVYEADNVHTWLQSDTVVEVRE